MNFDDIGRIWREEGTDDFVRRRIDKLSTVRDKATELDARVRRRDLRETLAAILVIPLCIFWAVRASTPISAIGAVILAITVAIAPFRLRMARRPVGDPTLPAGRAVAVEVARLREQEKLLGSVLVWHLGPAAVGFALFIGGSALVSPLHKALFLLVDLMGLGLILLLNRRAVHQKIRPLREELESWLSGFEDSSIEGLSDAH